MFFVYVLVLVLVVLVLGWMFVYDAVRTRTCSILFASRRYRMDVRSTRTRMFSMFDAVLVLVLASRRYSYRIGL